MTLSERLKFLRKQKKITQEELAKQINVERSTVGKYETGTTPSMEILIRIANYFDITIDYLLGNTDTKEQKEKTPSNDEDVKVALFGGDSEVTDEMWNEVKQYAEFIKSKYNKP